MKGAQILTVPYVPTFVTSQQPVDRALIFLRHPGAVPKNERPFLNVVRDLVNELEKAQPHATPAQASASRAQAPAAQAQHAYPNGFPTARPQEAQPGHLKTHSIGSQVAPRVNGAGATNRAAMALAAVGAPSQQANGQQAVSGSAHNSAAFGSRTWSRTAPKPVLSLGQ